MVIIYFLVVVYLLMEVGMDRSKSSVVLNTHLEYLNREYTELTALQNEFRNQGTAASVLAKKIRDNQDKVALIKKIKRLERLPKNKNNQKEIQKGIQQGYATLSKIWLPKEYLNEFNNVHYKLIVVISIFLLGIIAVMVILISLILGPLERIIRGAQKVSGGDLQVNFQVRTGDELSQLANVLNDLTTNFREILVLMKSSYRNGLNMVEDLRKIKPGSAKAKKEVKQSIEDLDDLFIKLKEITDYFSYKTN